MGFAVVADEVRALAQRSAQAARETANKIEGAIAKTSQGVQISGKVAQSLAEIVDKVRRVDQLVAEVSTASHEQSEGVRQITKAVTAMDRIVQGNAASAEESASAAEQLNAQSVSLEEAIEDLLRLASSQGAQGAPVAVKRVESGTASGRPVSRGRNGAACEGGRYTIVNGDAADANFHDANSRASVRHVARGSSEPAGESRLGR